MLREAKKYRRINPDKCARAMRRWRDQNPERNRYHRKKWWAKQPREKRAFFNWRRRVRKMFGGRLPEPKLYAMMLARYKFLRHLRSKVSRQKNFSTIFQESKNG
jgi:hypothetical protein